MKYPKKFDPTDDIPGDVKDLVRNIARRFRTPGLNMHLVEDYLHEQIYQEALKGADDNIARTADNLGVKYMTVWMYVRRRQNKLKREMGVGET